MIYSGGAVILFVLIRKWKNLISLTVSEQIATAEGMQPVHTRLPDDDLACSNCCVCDENCWYFSNRFTTDYPGSSGSAVCKNSRANGSYCGTLWGNFGHTWTDAIN